MAYVTPFEVELEEKLGASAADRLESLREHLRESKVPLELHARRGRPSMVIAKVAAELGCQLIVMGTRGNSGLAHVLLGSVAERTLRSAPCSVLVVKAEDAPVTR